MKSLVEASANRVPNNWEMFGGLPADSINTIEKIVKDNENDTYLGYDSRNYVKLFREAIKTK